MESEQGTEVCNFGNDYNYYPTEGVEPNDYDKLLISKAPEMLEMLKKCQEYFLLRTDEQSENNADKITQLIKQATEL